MPMLTWDDSLSVGVQEMDTQHKRLIELINQLFDAMQKGQGQEALKPVLDGVVQYAAEHFAAEERYMTQFNFPGFMKHKDEHELLFWKVMDLQKRFEAGQAMLSVETLAFLKTWLVMHIQETDKEYGACFTANGVK